jgi:DNA-binding IclR family transcriptional regulator
MTARQDVTEWIQLVRAEYLESPGLQLTKGQVQRLWGLDPSTCEAILEALEQAQFLKRTNANRYVRANGENDSQSRQS